MKKVLLIVAMLLVVSPAMATVMITAVNEGTKTGVDSNPTDMAATIRIGYNDSNDANVRAFALDINVDSGCTIENIRDFNVGENNSTVQGYGVFPGRFAQYVSPTSPNWSVSGYNPTVASGEPGASGTGLDTNTIIVEMGYLGGPNMVGGVDTNMPAKIGTLFHIDVNAYQFAGTATLTISADTMRGGIVSKDTNATTTATNLPMTLSIVFPPRCTTPANEVGVARATAEGVWTGPGQGFTLCGTGVVNCAQVGNIISQDTGCYSLPYCIHYTYGIQATEPNIVGLHMTDANNALIAAGITAPPTITYEANGLKPALTVDRESPAVGTQTCSTSYVVDTNCLYVGRTFTIPTGSGSITVTSAMVTLWNSLGQPNCWCCTSQKRGNGVYTGSSATKTDLTDLAAIKNKANYLQVDTPSNACLDFNMSGKIDLSDLAILKNKANYAQVTGPGPPCQ